MELSYLPFQHTKKWNSRHQQMNRRQKKSFQKISKYFY